MAQVVVKKIKRETKDAITIVFDVKPYSWDYEAGQFVTISMEIGGKMYHRGYSFQTSPYQDPLPAITVKRMTGGKVSSHLHDHLRVGDRLTCSLPQGKFRVDYQPNKAQQFVFFAGGSGIIPLFSMTKAVLYQMPKSSLQLIYANRDRESIIYREALEELMHHHGDRLQVTHVLSRATDGIGEIQGRLTPDGLRALLPSGFQKSLYFLCGPSGLMEMVLETLKKADVPPAQIRQESFKAAVQPNVLGCAAQMTVLYQGATYTCKLAPGATILDTLLEEGIEVPSSCCSGTCNTCRVRCLEGQVKMEKEEGLSEEEKAQGYVLSCVGYAASDIVKIEVED